MSAIDKPIERLTNNPRSARFSDVVRLLGSVGWHEVGGAGSHRRFEPADRSRFIIVVRPHGREPFCAVANTVGVLALVERERGRQREARAKAQGDPREPEHPEHDA